MSKEILKKEQNTWKRKGAYRVLNLMKEGKSISEISKEIGWREDTVWNFVSSPTFLRKLNDYLKCVFFNFQKNKILALEEVSKLFWDVAIGRKKVEGLTPDKASGYLIKLLKIQRELKITNPKDIITNIPKTSGEESEADLAKYFGFEKLRVLKDEKPGVHPEVNK